MLALEVSIRELRGLPVLTRVGLAVLVIGAVTDLAAHVAGLGDAAAHGHGFTADEVAAHLIVFAGMALVLLGVVVDGIGRSRPGRTAGNHQ